ncbi:MAG: hypothetical protein JSW71_05515, partial [Gemmatimonadota bacterium]
MPHFGRDYGARDVRAIDLGLDTQGVTGTIAELKLSADLGDPDLDPICADVISVSIGAVNVVNDVSVELLAGDIVCTSLRNFSASLPFGSGPGHTGNITVEGSYSDTMHFGGAMQGTITIEGTMSGTIEGDRDMANIIVNDDVSGEIVVGQDLSNATIGSISASGAIEVGRDLGIGIAFETSADAAGSIQVGRHLDSLGIGGSLRGPLIVGNNLTGHLSIGGALTGTITINGDMNEDTLIEINGWLDDRYHDLSGGHIIINGSLKAGANIDVGGGLPGWTEFIAIDYDGWDETDYWYSGGTIWVNGVPYYQNTPGMHLWDIQHCKGDMNNYEDLDPRDPDVLWHVVNDPSYNYATDFPGLAGSLCWHGDMDCSGEIDGVDVGALAFFAKDPPCCLDDAECTEYQVCRADLNRDGEVKLEDLTILLATYGLCEEDLGFNPDADFYNDGCVELEDLSFLLAVYGQTCSC